MIYYPPRLRFALVLHLFVSPASLPLCFASSPACNLYPFEVMTSGSQVCCHTESGEGGIGFRGDVPCRLLRCPRVSARLRRESRDWKQESSNPVYPRQLLSKHGVHGRTIVFCEKDKHRICILNSWLSLPRQKKNVHELSMNTNLKPFHGGPASRLEQIPRSKQSGQGKL